MALLRRLFYRKPPDGLLEISERVYVFDCCFTTDVLEEEDYKIYMAGIATQLRVHLPESSFMVFNFREGERQSLIDNILSQYDMIVMDYPRQYEGCPLLTMEMIHHFLRSSESWLSLGQQNVLLMHCERGGWPVLAFMLAALLIYRKQYTGEQKTLDMTYKQAPRELLQLLSPLNPLPSQLRYLQYVSRRNVGSEWPPLNRALTLDCVILRILPNFDGVGGCRPIFRIYGQDPFVSSDQTPKILFSTPKKSKTVRLYRQADCELVKIDIHCHIQGDVVLECINLDEDLEREEMMFRVMFNTAFIRSNILMLNRDEIDILWNAKDRFPKDFRAEVLLSDMDAAASVITMDLAATEDKEGLPVEAFAKVQEIFSSVDWLDAKGDAALEVLQQITSPNALQEKLDTFSPQKLESNVLLVDLSTDKPKERAQSNASDKQNEGSAQSMLEQQPSRLLKDSPDANITTKTTPHHHIHDAFQQSSLPKIVTQRIRGSPQSAPASYCSSLQSSPVPVSRYHSAPSALGITALLHDHSAYGKIEVSRSVEASPCTASVSTPACSRSPEAAESRRLSLLLPTPSPPPAPSPLECIPFETKAVPPPEAQPPPMPPVSPPPSPTPPPPPPPPPCPTSSPSASTSSSLLTSSQTPAFSGTTSNMHPSVPTPPPPPPPPPSPLAPSSFPRPPTPPPPPTKRPTGPAPPPPPPPPLNSGRPQPSNASPPPPPPPLNSGRPQPSNASPRPPPPPPPPLNSGRAQPSNASPRPPPPLLASSHSSVPTSKKSPVPPVPPPPLSRGNSKVADGAHPAHDPDVLQPAGTKGWSLTRSPSPRNSLSAQPTSKKATLKPLHWVKVTRAMQGSLWAEYQKHDETSKAPEFDMSELESLFSAAVPNLDARGSSEKSSRRASLGQKSDRVHLVDLRRANNCEIMLTKVKMPLPDLMSSVLALDDSILDVDQVDNLIKFCPTKEEMELLKGFSGDKESLGKCEQFFLELMKVPRVESKLRVFSFKIQFHSQVVDLSNSLNIVNSAAEEIRNSVKLKRIMQTILSLGNALNQGTARGSAIGFRLDSLLKLTDTRARNNKMTLMHYLCKVLAGKMPELLDFPKGLVSLEVASKIQLKNLAEEMQAISKGLEKVEQELTASENDGPVSHIFRKTLKEFLVIAESEVRALTLLYSGVGRNADALAHYFGEDPARCPFEQVVNTLLNFVRMFVRAHEENCKQLELERKKAQKEAENEKMKCTPKKEREKLARFPVRSDPAN